MTIGFGAIKDGAAITVAMMSSQVTSPTVYYNGQSITTGSGIGFDSQPFEDCLCSINVGVRQGALATLINSVLESDTDNPTAATALASASFTTLSGASTAGSKETGAIKCRDTKRFLFLKSDFQGSPITINFSAAFVGGSPREQPPSRTLVFDV